jgi:aspartyl-tRNA(Asn)/glutamyl-tRNA(Gln) amidotransferase subunit C
MALTTKEVEHIAHLARLQMSEEDIPVYQKNLSNILDLVTQMDSVDTQHIEPMAHPLDLTQRLREDKVTATNKREQFQAIAPLTEAGLYLVPKVIEEN